MGMDPQELLRCYVDLGLPSREAAGELDRDRLLGQTAQFQEMQVARRALSIPEARSAMTDRNCVACGQTTTHRLLFMKNECDIFRCDRCGLGSSIPRAHVDYEAIYNGGYFIGGAAVGYADYPSTEAVLRSEFRQSLSVLRKLRPRARTLLEIGSAYGYFLDEAKHFFQCTGVEYSAAAAAQARARGLRVIHAAVTPEVIEPLGQFDIITMFDTIEHLPNAADVIALCAKHLSSDGLLMMTTGDFGSVYARASGKSWRLMTPPLHIFYFTRASMEEISARNGLQVVSFEHPWKIVPLSLIIFQLPTLFGFSTRFRAPSLASRVGVPVNLYDAMRIVLRKQSLS
jgi:SAM-dependent methyltransferase